MIIAAVVLLVIVSPHRHAAAEGAVELHCEGLLALAQQRFQPPQRSQAVQAQRVRV
jgi:hypothetical protein